MMDPPQCLIYNQRIEPWNCPTTWSIDLHIIATGSGRRSSLLSHRYSEPIKIKKTIGWSWKSSTAFRCHLEKEQTFHHRKKHTKTVVLDGHREFCSPWSSGAAIQSAPASSCFAKNDTPKNPGISYGDHLKTSKNDNVTWLSGMAQRAQK